MKEQKIQDRDNKGRFIKGHKQSNSGRTHFKKGGTNYRLGKKNPALLKRNLENNPAKKPEAKKKISDAHLGKSLSEEHKLNIRLGNKGKHTGKKCNFWKGGKTPLIKLLRGSFEYKQWRGKVFERDDWTCQTCKKRGTYLEAHHTPKLFSQIIEENHIQTLEQAYACSELWDINNGDTLCIDCHNLTKKRRIKK